MTVKIKCLLLMIEVIWHKFLKSTVSLNTTNMKIRILVRSLVVMMFIAVASPAFSNAIEPVLTNTETPEEHVARLTKRLEEIKSMDKASMTRSERKALRTEVRAIKKEMAAVSGGVYISVGALILIALLLILLL